MAIVDGFSLLCMLASKTALGLAVLNVGYLRLSKNYDVYADIQDANARLFLPSKLNAHQQARPQLTLGLLRPRVSSSSDCALLTHGRAS